MCTRKIIWALAVVLMTGGVLAALAADADGTGASVQKKRAERQKARIKKGVEEGSITKGEAGRLIREQKRIRDLDKAINADGEVTSAERKKMMEAQNRASAKIAAQSNDSQTATTTRNWKVWDPGVNQRQRNQAGRIAQGIRTGSLTKDEAQSLISQEKDLAALEKDLKSDGVLTKEERQQLHDQLNALSKLIYSEKHDNDTGPSLNAVLKAKIQNGTLTQAEAAELTAQMKRVCELRRRLANDSSLTDEQRKAMTSELEQLAANLYQ
ncbi:MAG TPA: hypothetical protein P5137_05960 [Candidatus Brocadiia bacterium]|nr:hypothetical protein [Candidatus Brocadiia bacterium]